MCVCIYLYKKIMHLHTVSHQFFQFLISHRYFHLIPIYQRVTEQAELLSASQGSVVSVIPRQKKTILVL